MVRYSRYYGQLLSSMVELMLTVIFSAAENFSAKNIKNLLVDKIGDLSNHQVGKKQIANAFYELKRKGYITEIANAREKAIRITCKGKLKIIERVAASLKTDNHIRFLSFDIPERLHYQRDLFRSVIKRLGFCQVQQSLWAINKDVSEYVEMAANEYKVSDYIVYIVSATSNAERHIGGLLKK